ncbi:MAG: SGNH/GDSL hydrolase family protein, partial [Edaphobacter sp.]
SVLTDNSGNSNDGTLGSGAAAPAWTATGLSFAGNQIVNLPASLNGGQTFAMGLCLTTIPTNAVALTGNTYPVVISSTMTGAQGLSILYQMQWGNLNGGATNGVYGPAILGRGHHSTQSQVTFSGCHTYVVTLGTSGTSVDHMYLDGVEVGSYGLQGATVGAQSSGNLIIGASAASDFFPTSALNGTMYRLLVYPTALSGTDVSQLSSQMAAEITARGVNFKAPPAVPQGVPQLYAIGDSITNGVAGGGVTPWENSMTLTNQQPYVINNYGIGGVTMLAISTNEPNRVAPQCANTFGPNVAIVFAGTNDFNYYQTGALSSDATFTFGSMTGEIQTLKLAGCKVFVGTMLSRDGSGPNGATWDADKDAFDALVLANAKLVGADGIIDFAADPTLGADGASVTSAFQGDHIHPTQASQNRMGVIASNSLNYYFGSKLANPAVVTSNSYQMLSGDGAVTAAPTGNAAYTLPDCTGPSGESYTISNPQSAFTVTIAGKSGQPINGLATAITVPSNGTVTLRDVANPKNSSGCHWVM